MKSDTNKNPLVSFIVFGFKHEKFITEAVQSALSQKGPPIEIILSDDASPDRTFEIMKETAADYRGPHQVILNRNSANLGLAGHVNRAWQLCRGDFVVVQSGDDISLPDRTQKLVQRWLDSDRKLDLVCSFFEEMDDAGRATGRIKKRVVFEPDMNKPVPEWRCGATGACAAYSRKLYEKYGGLDNDVASEDWVFPFRAWLEGGIGLVEEPLVMHRTHDASVSVMAKNVSKVTDRRTRFLRRRKMQEGTLAIAEEWLRAWRIAKKGENVAVEQALEKVVRFRRAELEAYGATLASQLRLLPAILRDGGTKAAVRLCLRQICRIY